ncbi:uncharacterized protein LOC133142389 [Conger conger]|uniref:uncharacterized protein LOC133142389 n=1 Tax=Conger conger TaxID=82655 RepID=UPI002A5A77DB|nr:uncharacterized protein LOC133142389 [Conger conger]
MKTNEEIQVLLFMEGRYRPESQPERFRGRAEFFSEEIPKGNFSMKLRDVKTEDRGEFMCIVHTDNATAYVQKLVTTQISACLADISAWMTSHHLKLNLAKTELLYIPAKSFPSIDLSLTVEDFVVSSSRTAKNLGVTLDKCLTLAPQVSSTARTCRFFLYNKRRIRHLLTEKATQLLVQALVISRLDYCNSLLAGLPACAIKPLQLVQNAAARLITSQPRSAHVTPLLIGLHWRPIAAHICFKALVLAFQAAKGTAPPYIQSLITPYSPARPLRSASSGRLMVPSLRAPGGRAARSRLFSILVPQWWNDLPTTVRTAESLPLF